jgi:NADH-quinone oxidoreductase subunit E
VHARRLDRRLHRDRRLARHRHGRGRPLTLAEQIQELAAGYPQSRSAVLPALRLAQEEHGWLSPEALREVADALDLTPAYCKAVASFYDMFHLQPVGRHLIEVCTNISCALVGAQQVVEAFEAELGVRPGETTEDGGVTLRTIECAGGCGWGTVVAVDHRYREPVRAEDVPAIVEELRGR